MTVGITGGIGSGKSAVTRELAYRGYAFYDCDTQAKRIIAETSIVQFQITKLFGKRAFSYNRYNAPYVAKRVFEEPELLKQLNEIVHPHVLKDLEELTRYRRERGAQDPLFVESAILFESGLARLCDQIIVLDAPDEVRIKRVIDRDYHGNDTPKNRELIQARINAQRREIDSQMSVTHFLNDGNKPINELVNQILISL